MKKATKNKKKVKSSY